MKRRMQKKITKSFIAMVMAITLSLSIIPGIGMIVWAGYDASSGTYTYSTSAPLYAATHFHIFAHENVSIDVHTHGNVACNILNCRAGLGTRPEFYSGNESTEVTYVRKIKQWEPASVVGTLILGSNYQVTSADGAGQTIVEDKTENKPIVLGTVKKSNVIIEKEGNHIIDLDSEFTKLKERSAEWSYMPSSSNAKIDLTRDHNLRAIELYNVNMDSGVTFVNVPYEEITASTNKVSIWGIDGNTAHTGIVVFNVDLKGQTNPALSFPMEGCTLRDNVSGMSINNKEVGADHYGVCRFVWNFYDSSKPDRIYDGKISWTGVKYGTVLAPGADVTCGAVNGTVIAENVNHTGDESHRWDIISDRITPEETEAPTESVTPKETETPSESVTPKETETPTESVTPKETETPSESVTPKETETPKERVIPKETETPTEHVTPKETETPTESVTPKETETPKETVTPPDRKNRHNNGRTVNNSDKKKGNLHVTIYDKKTKKRIPNAKVDIVDEDGEIVRVATTDENGDIFVKNLEPGSYTVRVTSIPNGYNNPGTQKVKITSGKTTMKYLKVKKDTGIRYGGSEETNKGTSTTNYNKSTISPQTGDVEAYMPFVVIMAVFLVGLLALYYSGKRYME